MDWILTDWDTVLIISAKTIIFYFGIILYSRILGLRSFSKMSTFDFAMTVAVGSMMATTALTPDPPIANALITLGILYSLQFVVSQYRLKRSDKADTVVDNSPKLIMRGNEIMEDNLHDVGMTKGDLYSKIRLAGVSRLDTVYAVVMETTGDVSVIYGAPDDEPFDYNILYGVSDNQEIAEVKDIDVENGHDDTRPSLNQN